FLRGISDASLFSNLNFKVQEMGCSSTEGTDPGGIPESVPMCGVGRLLARPRIGAQFTSCFSGGSSIWLSMR
ncbi:hypothetical protein, partial [Collinsella aerofaciens]|uniref:hypothetical protein n=1 Tax=Collinsella aerofaciens TaxID=74426 RepID=UPI00232F7094